jgi:hypothetical protein
MSGRETTRAEYIRRIEDALGMRKLYWFGPRGADGRALLALDQFDGSFSLMAPLEAVSVGADVSLETLTGVRVDHNTYSLETDASDSVRELRSRLLSALSQPSAVLPYRPNRFLSNICFPRAATVQHLGQFYEHQSQFEHKPWVESELKRIGVSVLPWTYFADEDKPRLREFFHSEGAIVLRASRSDGGARVELITDGDELERLVPLHDDGFLSACRFFGDALSLNVNGCIFRDGTVILQGLSEQLIGRPELVGRRFGYCGNVFKRACDWPTELVGQFEYNARLVGKWLHSQGYLGVFGLDALFADGKAYIVEINPRFQGSTWAVADIDRELERPDLYLCQIAAELGLDAPVMPPFGAPLDPPTSVALLIAHNLENGSVRMDPGAQGVGDPAGRVDLVARTNISIEPSAIVARITTRAANPLTSETIRKNLFALGTLRYQSDLF